MLKALYQRLDRALLRAIPSATWQGKYINLNKRLFRAWWPAAHFVVDVPHVGQVRVNKVDVINAHLYYYGVWEPGLSALVRNTLRPGDIAIDVGANIGYYSLLAARLVGPQGAVWAFEASPSVYASLTQHLAANACSQVVALHVAVSDAPGELDLYKADASNVGHSGLHPEAGRAFEARVPALPLSAALREVDAQRIRLIKIDVEGSEPAVVRGLAPLLPLLPLGCRILLEVSRDGLQREGMTARALLAPFLSQGFSLQAVANRYDAAFYYRPAQQAELTPVEPEDLDGIELADVLLERVAPAIP